MAIAYAYFYNPFHLLRAALTFDELWEYRVSHQVLGNLRNFKNLYQDRAWLYRMMTGPIERQPEPPGPKCPMIVPDHTDLALAHYSLGERRPVVLPVLT